MVTNWVFLRARFLMKHIIFDQLYLPFLFFFNLRLEEQPYYGGRRRVWLVDLSLPTRRRVKYFHTHLIKFYRTDNILFISWTRKWRFRELILAQIAQWVRCWAWSQVQLCLHLSFMLFSMIQFFTFFPWAESNPARSFLLYPDILFLFPLLSSPLVLSPEW